MPRRFPVKLFHIGDLMNNVEELEAALAEAEAYRDEILKYLRSLKTPPTAAKLLKWESSLVYPLPKDADGSTVYEMFLNRRTRAMTLKLARRVSADPTPL
jgi:hypothetical protein